MNEHLPTLLLQILLVGFTPGPANIYALTMSLRHGRRVSLVMWLGMLVGFSIAVSVMALLTHLLGVAFGFLRRLYESIRGGLYFLLGLLDMAKWWGQ